MKMLLLLAFISTTAFAGETKTECPWMKEMNKRTNPKANLISDGLKLKNSSKTSVTSGQ